MGERRRRRSGLTGRPAMRSPGRPPVARREDQQRFRLRDAVPGPVARLGAVGMSSALLQATLSAHNILTYAFDELTWVRPNHVSSPRSLAAPDHRVSLTSLRRTVT
jgi:hypothetical protein